MAKKIRPIAINEFPLVETNCLGFAIGDTTAVKESQSKYNLDHHYSIEEAFIRKLSELGYSTANIRKIENLESAKSNEFVYKVYGFNKSYYKFMGFQFECYDFHVVRRELDNSWVHKPGWKDEPCIIKGNDWPKIEEEFGKNFVLFALSNSPEEE